MIERKELKRSAKQVVKKHYVFLIVACLIAALLSSDFTYSFDQLSALNEETAQTQHNLPSSSLDASDVIAEFLVDGSQASEELAQEITDERIENSTDPIFGLTNGVFARIVNALTSGSIYIQIIQAIASIVGSDSLAIVILIGLGLLFIFMIWFFIQNVFTVILRRIFLEARTYEKVPFSRYMFLSHVKKWIHASFTLFLTYIYQTLWSLTIIGGIIKHYSYFLVPYIVAEDPSIGANKAITLSRKMMKGHKWECFKIDLSFIGWIMLSGITLGLSSLFYSNAYQVATFSEYYVTLRKEAKEKGIEGSELLNDHYLYEKASVSELEKAYPEAKDKVERPRLKGVKGFFAEFFGLLFKEGKEEKAYEEELKYYERYREVADVYEGKSYPTRLFTIKESDKRVIFDNLEPMRVYTIWSVILMFFIFSMIGWLWEVSLHLITDGTFVNRGAMFGPWLPIYGSGGILILLLLKKFRDKPWLNFILIIIVCGILEYTTSYVMEMNNGLKWWDYTGYFLNLNGRICAEGLMVFGIGGMAFAYVLAPVFDGLIKKIKPSLTRTLCIILVIAFISDMIYSHFYPNTGEGITDYAYINRVETL